MLSGDPRVCADKNDRSQQFVKFLGRINSNTYGIIITSVLINCTPKQTVHIEVTEASHRKGYTAKSNKNIRKMQIYRSLYTSMQHTTVKLPILQ